METTIIINTDSITQDFIEGIQKLFPAQGPGDLVPLSPLQRP